jgi:DNA polymerase III epsilon subunit-like protein
VTERQIIVVDVETTGLDPSKHVVVEVSWCYLAAHGCRTFIPKHDVSKALGGAEVIALQINRYLDRIAGVQQDDYYAETDALFAALEGNTLAGSNPAFDAAFLKTIADPSRGHGLWHHRLLDLAPYAAGVLHLPPTELPGLNTVCELLDVVNAAPHTAWGDAFATQQCFNILTGIAASTKVVAP